MVKRKGSITSKDEERGSKRRLRSGRIIETLTSPLRLTKEVVTASSPSNPRVKPFVKPFTSSRSKSAIKIVGVINGEDGLDETDDELCSTSSHDSLAQAIVVNKKTLSSETNLISADMSSVEKKRFRGQIPHGKTSKPKAKLTRKTARGIVTTFTCCYPETYTMCRWRVWCGIR